MSRWKLYQRAEKIREEVKALQNDAHLWGDSDLRDTMKELDRVFSHPRYRDHASQNDVVPTTQGRR